MSEVLKTPELSKVAEELIPKDQVRGLEENAALAHTDPNYDPEKGPLALFALYGPQLYSHVDQLSSRQLRRLLKALVTWPLEDVQVNKKNPIELSAYNIANEMITSRFLLTMIQAHDEQERRKKADEEYRKTLGESKETQSAFSEAQKLAGQQVPLTVSETNVLELTTKIEVKGETNG